MNQSLSTKFGQKLLDSTKKSATDAPKTALKAAIQKMAETTGDLVGNEIAEKITKATSKSTGAGPSKSMMSTQMMKRQYNQLG